MAFYSDAYSSVTLCIYILFIPFSYMNKFGALLKLTRAEHSIMLVIAVVSAELIAKGLPNPFILALSLITPIMISSASFAINDYFDVEVDRKNKKDRPLINGSLSPSTALHVTVIGILIGIISSALINPYCLVIAVIFGALALLYSYRLKDILLLGNMYIAVSMSIPFVFGSYVVNSSLGLNIILISFMIFLSGVAREIHGTIRDYAGDVKIRKANTLPKVIGKKNSSVVAFVLYMLAIIISVYLFAYIVPFKYRITYLLMIIVSDIMLVFVSFGYLYKKNKGFYKMSRKLSLLAMGIALTSFLLVPFHSFP